MRHICAMQVVQSAQDIGHEESHEAGLVRKVALLRRKPLVEATQRIKVDVLRQNQHAHSDEQMASHVLVVSRSCRGEPRDRDGTVTAPVGDVPGSRAGTI